MHQRRDAKAVETAAGDCKNVNFNLVSQLRQCGRWVSSVTQAFRRMPITNAVPGGVANFWWKGEFAFESIHQTDAIVPTGVVVSASYGCGFLIFPCGWICSQGLHIKWRSLNERMKLWR